MRRGVFCRIEPVGSASAFVFGAFAPSRRRFRCDALHLRIARLEIAQEPGQRIAGGNDPRHLAELGAVGAEPAGDHVEGAAVGSLGHLGRVFVAEPRGAELVLGQRIGNAGAQHVGALRVGERLEALPIGRRRAARCARLPSASSVTPSRCRSGAGATRGPRGRRSPRARNRGGRCRTARGPRSSAAAREFRC